MVKGIKDINDKNNDFNYVRVSLYTPTPGCKSNDWTTPVTHSQQSEIGVPPISRTQQSKFWQ